MHKTMPGQTTSLALPAPHLNCELSGSMYGCTYTSVGSKTGKVYVFFTGCGFWAECLKKTRLSLSYDRRVSAVVLIAVLNVVVGVVVY